MPKPNKGESKQDFLSRCTKDVMAEGKESDQAYAMCNASWDNENNQRSTLTLSAPIELMTNDEGKAKHFLITAYTGQPIDTWMGKIIFDVAGMTSKAKIPILREHERDRVVGFGKTWKDESRFYVGGDFASKTRDAQEVLSLAEDGMPWQASVGIWPKKVKVLSDEKESMVVNGQEIKGPAEVWTESRVGEVSFVSLGADDETAAIVLSDQKVRVSIEKTIPVKKEEKKMEFTLEIIEKEAPQLLEQIRSDAAKLGMEAGTALERERVNGILDAKADPEATTEAIKHGYSAEASYKLFYEAEKKKKVEGLKKMEADAPKPMGQEEPKEKSATPDVDLAIRARDLAEKEKIPIVSALRKLARDNPELAKEALPKFRIANVH